MFKLQKIGDATYVLPKEGKMKVPGLLIANEELLNNMDGLEKPLQQMANVATLPGIVGYSIAMPDIHWGYGFPIGGVAAMDAKEGVISPGGVGYDINCGVRMAWVPMPFSELSEKTKLSLLRKIFEKVPSGIGEGQKKKLTSSDYNDLCLKGASWAIELGHGFEEDLTHIESFGKIENASLEAVSTHAKDRGRNQLGSIGSGNHFVEIGEIKEIFGRDIAKTWGIEEGFIYILIHTGSRGFGHQICQDTLHRFIQEGYAKDLVDKQLVAAPIQSAHGQEYIASMAAAANFAFNNRQMILHAIRESFQEVCSIPCEQIKLLYDVCHNIAKFEMHEVEGKMRQLCVHRKGATRAFGPNDDELPAIYRDSGQPVLVPGDMARESYLLAGLGNPLTWKSSCHGAGRAKSRKASLMAWGSLNTKDYMQKQGIQVMAKSPRTIAEEMPDAYKDVDLVVEAVERAALANKIARLTPQLVIKG